MGMRSNFIWAIKSLTKRCAYSPSLLTLLPFLLLVNSGCSQVALKVEQLPSLLPDLSSEANLQIQVRPSTQKGAYTVGGTTNLPDDSDMAVVAVRHLRPDEKLLPGLGSNPTYSILDYQDVKVENGRWQTTLNLWKVARDGRFQEAWQLEQPLLGLKLLPESEVTFLVTLAPTEVLWDVEQRLDKQGIKLVSALIRNTVEGDRYVQVSQGLSVPLPTGSTAPPPQRPEDLNGGWGPRYILLPEPPNKRKLEQPDHRRIDTPLSPDELMY